MEMCSWKVQGEGREQYRNLRDVMTLHLKTQISLK